MLKVGITCSGPSVTAWIIIGTPNNDWVERKDAQLNSVQKHGKKRSVETMLPKLTKQTVWLGNFNRFEKK